MKNLFFPRTNGQQYRVLFIKIHFNDLSLYSLHIYVYKQIYLFFEQLVFFVGYRYVKAICATYFFHNVHYLDVVRHFHSPNPRNLVNNDFTNRRTVNNVKCTSNPKKLYLKNMVLK